MLSFNWSLQIGFTVSLLLISLNAFSQKKTLEVHSSVETTAKKITVEIDIVNNGDQSLFIETRNFSVAQWPLDSVIRSQGLVAYLESKNNEFIPYSTPMTFVHSDNVKRDARRMNRLNKYPKMKLKPKQFVLIDKNNVTSLLIEFPIQHWNLIKGQTYKLSIHYFPNQNAKPPKNKNAIQLDETDLLEKYFSY